MDKNGNLDGTIEENGTIDETKSIKEEKKSQIRSLQKELEHKTVMIDSLMKEHLRWTTEIQKVKEEQLVSIKAQENQFREHINKTNLYHLTMRKELQKQIIHNLNNNNKIYRSLMDQIKDGKTKECELEKKIQELNELYQRSMTECVNIKASYEVLDKLHTSLKQEHKMKEEHLESLRKLQEEGKMKDDEILFKYDKLLSEKTALELEMKKFSKDMDLIEKLETDNSLLKKSNEDFQQKLLNSLAEINNKQYTLEENKVGLTDLKNKLNYANQYIEKLEKIQKEQNEKIVEFLDKINRQSLELVETKSSLEGSETKNQLLEKELAEMQNEIDTLNKEYEENEKNTMSRIASAVERHSNERHGTIIELEGKLESQKQRYEQLLNDIKSDMNKEISAKDVQIQALMNNLKSLTESQHAIFQDTEKIKLANEKMKLDQSKIDEKTLELKTKYERDIEEIRQTFKREKDTLIYNYEQLVRQHSDKNSDDSNKLTRTLKILEEAKKTISDLTNDNKKLQVTRQEREKEVSEIILEITAIKNQNLILQTKLDQALELNVELTNKNTAMQQAIRTLQLKNGELAQRK